MLRVDHAKHILGLRLNTWTCLVVFLAVIAYLLRAWHTDRTDARAHFDLDDGGADAVVAPIRVADADDHQRRVSLAMHREVEEVGGARDARVVVADGLFAGGGEPGVVHRLPASGLPG